MLRKLIKFQEKGNVKNTAVISKENQSLQNSIKKLKTFPSKGKRKGQNRPEGKKKKGLLVKRGMTINKKMT